MKTISKIKKGKKITDNLDFTNKLFLFIDVVDDYFFNYDPKKENKIILMYNIIKNNLTDYATNTEAEKKRKQELLSFLEKGFKNFNFRKDNPLA